MPEILVTGATGTFGQAVLDILQKLGVEARVFVRDPSTFNRRGFDLSIGDFGDPASLDKALSGIKRVFLASFDTPQMPALQLNLLNAARRQGVEHIARISTIGVDNPRLGPIMAEHAHGERNLEGCGIAFTHLRPSWVLQNFLLTSSATPVRDGKIRLPAGNGRVGFVDARDVAAVAVTSLTEEGHGGKAYELTGPDARTHEELATALSKATGHKITFENLPPRAYAKELEDAGWPPASIESMDALFSGIRDGDAAIVTDDVERVTGRTALSILDFAKDHAELFAVEPPNI